MWILFFSACLALADGLPFPGSPSLADCPNIRAQEDIQTYQVWGSWRLAYLFIDNPEELEEDDSCVVTEFSQVNETELELQLFIEGRKNEFTVERSTTEMRVAILSPGEWAIHTPLISFKFIHATVIAATPQYLILTFCSTEHEIPNEETGIGDFEKSNQEWSLDKHEKEYRSSQRENPSLLDNFNARLNTRLLRRRSHGRDRRQTDFQNDEDSFEKSLTKYLEANEKPKSEKHLWTTVLVKNNNISALNYVQFASVLMKHGFDITKGQLISFGKCDVSRK